MGGNCLHPYVQLFYGPFIQDNPGDPVLSQRRDLLEQLLDFCEPDVLPATQPAVSKYYRKTWLEKDFNVFFCLKCKYHY